MNSKIVITAKRESWYEHGLFGFRDEFWLMEKIGAAMAAEDGSLHLSPPIVVTLATAFLFVLALLQFVVPVLFVMYRLDIHTGIETLNRSLPADTIRGIADGTIIGSVALHALIAMLYVWLAVLIRKAHKGARIAVTALLVLDTLGGWLAFHAASNLIPRQMPYVIGEETISLVLRIAALSTLWGPRSSSSYFASPRTR